MNKTRHYIRILLLVLLLSGMVSEAWAKKVTYHILTKPFTVRNYNNTGDWKVNIRVEALQCTSEESTVGLPDQFKSPLATGFRYWKKATSTYEYLYDYENNNKIVSSKYYIYQCEAANAYACLSEEITTPDATSTDADGFPNDIYVTYDYVNDKEEDPSWRNDFLELNGQTDYNVTVNISGKQRFMCFNRSRNNRVANALASALTGEQLVSDDFVVPDNTGNKLGWSWGSWGPIGLHLGFKFLGEDPYNITIMTSYQGNEVHVSDAITNVDVTPYSSTNQNKATIKPYKGATLFGKLGNNQMWFDASNDRHYKVLSGCGQNDWKDGSKYEDCKTRYEATPEQARYDTWVGFYRNETPTMNSYALLPNTNGEYLFVGSKMNQNNTTYQPDKNGYYALYNDNSNNPCFKFQAFSSAYKTNLYEIRSYVLHIKTHGSKTEFTKTMKWSDAMASDKIVDHIPEVLKRKYCSYKAYSDAALTKEITTFTDAIVNVKDANGKIDISKLEGGKNIAIWLDYTVSESFPFDTLQAVNKIYNYQNARWYTMRMNGKAEQKNIAYNSSNSLITGSPSIGSESNLHTGENSADAMVAFIGDPYELKIISRASSESAGANRFIGCATGATDNTTLNSDKEDTSGNIITWEMVYENTDMGNFVLRQFNTYDNPRYIGWNTEETNKPVVYSSATPTNNNRIRVVELEEVSYTYHIVRVQNGEGSIAVKASASHDIGKVLSSWENIPEIIRSPFLAPSYYATVTYYATIEDAVAETNAISNAPYDSNRNIFVRYAYDPEHPLTGKTYNVILNTEYIYTNSVLDDNTIYNKKNITSGSGSEAENGHFQWALDYSDPYNMTIKNQGKNKYIKVASRSNDAALNWNIDVANATRFIAKSGSISGTFEVMLATGSDIDASTEYYNIGRPDANTVKLYDNGHYITGNATLQFQLIGTEATNVHYHLIDMAGKELLDVVTRQTDTDPVAFPPQYRSPLVKTYHYYLETDFTKRGDTYTLNSPTPAEQSKVGLNEHFYVTYDVNDLVNLKSGQLYLLKYEAGESFKQEDGSDGLATDAQKAIYPYVNGDGNFFVYGQEQYDLQQEGAASTRTRWAWYVQSDLGTKGDPYHVTIKSRQTESYPISNSSEYNAYFMTYKPEGYSEVVTTLAWPGMSGETATEYMVLGSEGQYQLVTTYEIGGSRYVVNSFEQYWKTWDTIRKKVYGESSAKENDDDPWTIPLEALSKYNGVTEKTLRDSLTNELHWHSYEKWAYAKRWNGYNNGYSSAVGTHETKKGWETIEHWYQTVDMGEGYFDFVKTDINPVLILLDQHGWEIMRKPIPTSPDDPEKNHKYEAIRSYNSPMVKEYAFWATAKKRSGFHQYYLLSDRIGGDTFTSTDLTNLPPYDSKNVHDKKGNLNDQYVTYIVKDEYAQTYNPKTATGKPFLIEQGTKYASTSDGTAITKNNVSDVTDMKTHILKDVILNTEKWYVKPNANIDIEMGYNDTGHSWTRRKADGSWDNKNPNAYEHYKYKDSLIAQYINDKDSLGYFSFSNGFDPYNIQISSVNASSKYMKTNANGATLDEGSIIGSYPTDPGTITMGDNEISIKNPKVRWYDSRNLDVTNATFMAVQDAAGNMQLMPRFDHDRRMSEFGELIAPTDAEVATTYTKLYRPEVYEYLIIDNDGHESLRYKSGGDLLPQTPDHFKSPLATNFTYYATATETSGTYSIIKENQIKGALDGATLTNNMIYVRYEYDEDADNLNILKGNWLTMQLDNNTAQYTTVESKTGIYSSSTTYSLTAINDDDLVTQAKKLTDTTVDYYFKVGDNYYKVHVTNIVGETLATYTATSGSYSTNWDASTEKLTAADNADLEYQAKRLTEAKVYYFRVGSTGPYTYYIVTVSSAYKASYAEYTKTSEANSSNWDASKPLVVNADGKKWQWKFLKNQQSKPDPYAVYLFNRDEKDAELPDGSRFAILSHSSGDYALAKAGRGDYTYQFLNGDGGMTTSEAAKIATESGFTSSIGTFSGTNSQVKLTNEVQYAFTYTVYTNEGKFAIQANQTQDEVENNDWAARIPNEIKTPLLNLDQFRYYDKDDYVKIVEGKPDTIGKNLSCLYGLYGDEVVVRYTPYNPSVTEYQVPNVRNATSEATVAKGIGSNDAPLDLSQTMAYNVIWYNDNMMTTTGTDVVGEADQAITKVAQYEWKIGGDDPYAMKFYNVYAGKYITAASVADEALCTLDVDANATTFMLLPKDGYDYGMLAITGNESSKLTITDDGKTGTKEAAKITTSDPAKFIIFALATHKVIYHLMIKNIGQKVIIPYKGTDTQNDLVPEYLIQESGTTLRDLKTRDTSGGIETHIDGDLYQLGATLKAIGENTSGANTTTGLYARDSIYCYDAGHISLGDKLEVPSVFYRPNVKYRFIVEGVYDESGANEVTEMNNKYKGWETETMGDDEGLLHNTVFVNIVYSFNVDLGTNSGSGFVTSVAENKWYSFDTNDATPMLAHYTAQIEEDDPKTYKATKTKSGYATHYTNDYLWTPVGDPYGFKMYNRYACKNLEETTMVMTTKSIAAGQAVMMGDEEIEGGNGGRDIYELIANSTTTPGYFRVHPMMNKIGSGIQYYMNSNSSTGALTLSATPTEWKFGLSEDMMRPYREAAGYVGGLNAAGKAAYDTAPENETLFDKLVRLQDVVYNHDNNPAKANFIVHYTPGYYRLHSMPGSSGITTKRYVSGYTHKIELTAGDGSTAIPMHFYEVEEYNIKNPVFSDLGTAGTNYTGTNATQGDIPLSTVTSDPASIFKFTGETSSSVTMSTQGLYVKEEIMTETAGDATSFSIIDLGGGVIALQNGTGSLTSFLNYNQNSTKYDLKFNTAVDLNNAVLSGANALESTRWCMQPVQKAAEAGDGEMELRVTTNNGGNNYYYATFCAPFDVLLTNEKDEAYVLPTGDGWPTITPPATSAMIHPKKIGKYNTVDNDCPEDYQGNNRFVPAGTPVIIRTSNPIGYVTMALPTTTPSTTPVSCVFSGKYLEQVLPHGDDYVYVFGRSLGTFVKDASFATNGHFSSITPTVSTDIGFYVNANPNKEESEFKVSWTRNNKYVYANKIYYRSGSSGASSRQDTRGADFIPVVFDDDDDEPIEEEDDMRQRPADNRVYDLQGRQIENGKFVNRKLKRGLYIVNGKKVMIK